MKKIAYLVLIILLVALIVFTTSCGETVYVRYEPENLTVDYDKKGQEVVKRLREVDFNDEIKIYNGNGVKALTIEYMEPISGEYSRNLTRQKYGVVNADISVVSKFNGKLYYLFGDTSIDIGEGFNAYYISNTYAVSSDYDFYDGIIFDSYYTKDNLATPIIEGDHMPSKASNWDTGLELTKIPNGGVQIGDYFYMTFMSVAEFNHNGDGNDWLCNYGGMVKTKDMLTWEKLDFATDKNSNFLQNFPVLRDGYVYMFGIGAGRYTAARLMRTKAENIDKLDSYEYLIGYNGKEPTWGSKDEGFNIIDNQVAEYSVVYNKYLKKWMFSYTIDKTFIYTADNVYGPYNLAVEVNKPRDLTYGWYCTYTNSDLFKNNGKVIPMFISFMASKSVEQADGLYKNQNIWNVNLLKYSFEKE